MGLNFNDTYICVNCLAVFKAEPESSPAFRVVPGNCPYCSHEVVQTEAHVIARILKIVESTQRQVEATSATLGQTADAVDDVRTEVDRILFELQPQDKQPGKDE